MREIIGENLQSFFRNMQIDAIRTYSGNIGYWPKFEVWQLSDKDYKRIGDMSEEEYERIAADDSWWRGANGSNMGVPHQIFNINGKPLLAWSGYKRDELYDEYNEMSEEEKEEYDGADDYVEFWAPLQYDYLLKYFCEELGASTERNVCALVTDLAKYNNMTIGELFEKYGG